MNSVPSLSPHYPSSHGRFHQDYQSGSDRGNSSSSSNYDGSNQNAMIVIVIAAIFFSTLFTLFPQHNITIMIRTMLQNLVMIFKVTIPQFVAQNFKQAWDEVCDDDEYDDDDVDSDQYRLRNNLGNEENISDMDMSIHEENEQDDGIGFQIQNQIQNMSYHLSYAFEWMMYIIYYVIYFILDWSPFSSRGLTLGGEIQSNNKNYNIDTASASNGNGVTHRNNINNKIYTKNSNISKAVAGKNDLRRRRERLGKDIGMPVLEEVIPMDTEKIEQQQQVDENEDKQRRGGQIVDTDRENKKTNLEKSIERASTSTIKTNTSLPHVEYSANIEPAFLNEEDYPVGWLVYDPIRGEVVTKESLPS